MGKLFKSKNIDQTINYMGIGFRMLGIHADKAAIETIIALVERYQEKGGKTALSDIAEIEVHIQEKYPPLPLDTTVHTMD